MMAMKKMRCVVLIMGRSLAGRINKTTDRPLDQPSLPAGRGGAL
jgi:hypothetical protein